MKKFVLDEKMLPKKQQLLNYMSMNFAYVDTF